MAQFSGMQRWISVVLLGFLLGLMMVCGLPAVAFRVGQAFERGRYDTRKSREIAPELVEISSRIREARERIKPAVVRVSAIHSSAGQPNPIQDQHVAQDQHGSGLIIATQGYVLTSRQLVADARRLEVQLQGATHGVAAELVDSDAGTDLALLKFDARNLDLIAAEFGNSDRVSVGDHVLAVGNPFGQDASVAMGIVCAKCREPVGTEGETRELIQTDASIPPGNGGGPLINLAGQVVGINTVGPSSNGARIGFAIPANRAANVIRQFQKEGHATRGWLGVFVHGVLAAQETGEFNGQLAIQVDHALPGSPASNGGVQAGDLILDCSGMPFHEVRELQSRITAIRPGTRVPFTIFRQGHVERIQVVLQPLPERAPTLPGEREWGVRLLSWLSPELARGLSLETTDGVLVRDVDPGQPAGIDLHAGDLIVAINGTFTPSLEAYCRQMNRLDLHGDVELGVRSRNGKRVVMVSVK